MKTEILEVNGAKYIINVFYENRNSSRVSIGKAITIRLPISLNREEMAREELKLKHWARAKLEESPKRFAPSFREYQDGEVLEVGEEKYILKIQAKDKQSSSARIISDSIQLFIASSLSQEERNRHISALLSRCIAQKRLPKLKERISSLNNEHFKQPINKIFFKHNKSNWGSCSKAGNINISTRLLFAPDDILNYVCIHELAHLIEQNHSERFWGLVEKAMPGYKEKVKWLKENMDKCSF